MSTHATGPRTAAGKERSSMNATTHGLCSEKTVLPCEDADAWQAFHNAVVAELEPVGVLENEYANRIALHHWRLRRVARFEGTVTSDLHEAATSTAAGAMIGLSPNDPSWKTMLQAHRDLENHKEDLAGQQAARDLVQQLPTMPDAAVLDSDLVLYLVHMLGKTSVVEIKEPVTAEIMRRELPTTAEKSLPETLAELTTGCDEDIQETTEEMAATKRRFDRVAHQMAAHIELQGHDHLILHKPELDRLVRYEAHTERQLKRAMDALEKIQAKRRARDAERGEDIPVCQPHGQTGMSAPPVRSAESASASLPEAIARCSQLPPQAAPAERSSFRRTEEVLAELATPRRFEAWPGGAAHASSEFVPQISTTHRNGTPVMADSHGSS